MRFGRVPDAESEARCDLNHKRFHDAVLCEPDSPPSRLQAGCLRV